MCVFIQLCSMYWSPTLIWFANVADYDMTPASRVTSVPLESVQGKEDDNAVGGVVLF